MARLIRAVSGLPHHVTQGRKHRLAISIDPRSSSPRPQPPHSHSIILRHRNALIFRRKFFLGKDKDRLPDPSEICALDFKGKFRRFKICSVQRLSASIGRFLKSVGESGVIGFAEKRPSRRPSRLGQSRPEEWFLLIMAGIARPLAFAGSWFPSHQRSPCLRASCDLHRLCGDSAPCSVCRNLHPSR
jgi:hypothetical protein